MRSRWASLNGAVAALGVFTLLSWSAHGQGFSAELPLGVDAESAPVLWHREPQVAFDGQNYVVAWLTDRRDLAPFGGGSLVAARIDERGALLDPHGIFVSRELALGSLRLARAPWGSLVVYVNDDGVLVSRLNRQGQLADSVPLRLAKESLGFPSPTAACSDTDCFVTWTTSTGTAGVALDACGAPVAGTELSLPAGEWQMVYGDDTYLLVGKTTGSNGATRTVKAVGVRRDGALSWGPRDLPIPPTSERLMVARGAEGYLLAWNEPSGATSSAGTLSLDDQGSPKSSPQLVLQGSAFFVVDLAWEVDHYRATLQEQQSLATLRLDVHGGLLDGSPAELARADDNCANYTPRIAVGNESTLLVWDWGTNGPACEQPPPTSVVLDHDSWQPGAPFRFDGSAARMGAPAIGTDGNGYLAAWYEDRAGATGLYTRRLASDGTALEEPVLTIEAEPHPAPAPAASVAFVGGRYLVALTATHTRFEGRDEPGMVATVDASTGERGSPHAGELGTPGTDGFLMVRHVVRQSGEDLLTLESIAVARSDADGTPVDPDPIWVHPRSGASVYMESDGDGVAGFDGRNFAVVWNHWMDVRVQKGSPPDPPPETILDPASERQRSLLFMPFGPDAVPLVTAPIALPGLATFKPVTMTFGGGAYLLVLLSDQQLLTAVRVTPAGQVLDAGALILSAIPFKSSDSLTRISATYDGREYKVAFDIPHPPSAPGGAFAPVRHDLDLYVTSISIEGTLGATQVVGLGPQDELGGALASLGDGTALIGYQRLDPAPEFMSMRAYVRRLGTNECKSLTECGPDGCDGVCCAAGCAPAPGSAACTVSVCPETCPAGSHCSPGLGCVADDQARVTAGCGCETAPRRSGPAWPLVASGLALAGLRQISRARRQKQSRRTP